MSEPSKSAESRFARILQGTAQSLDVEFQHLTSQITHPGAKGSAREKTLIRELLRKYLPARFGLTRGEIVSSNDEVSAECDAIIYDALESPALYTNEDYQIVPVEAVYAVIEVKSHLDSDELEKTFKNFQKIKRFPKKAFIPVQPELKRRFNCFGKVSDYFPVAGFLFAYRSSTSLDTLATRLRDLQKDTLPDHRIELVCALDSGCLFNADSTLTLFTPSPNTTVCSMPSDRPLHFFMALLQNLLSTARTDPIAINT
jgi:hypothetical protein